MLYTVVHVSGGAVVSHDFTYNFYVPTKHQTKLFDRQYLTLAAQQ